MNHKWNSVWDARPAPPQMPSLVERLLVGGGMDSGFAGVSDLAWLQYVERIAGRLGLQPDESVFEVGCGAGAFLYLLHQRGMRVSGIDRSAALVAVANEVLAGGEFKVADAADLDTAIKADAVLSSGVFLYFPSVHYAECVLDRMVAKATRVVAILDIPDAAKRESALAERVRRSGGPEEYERKYAGMDHQYYSQEWFAEALRKRGLTCVHVEDQEVAGYGNAPFRFNAWGVVSGGRRTDS